MIDNETFAWTGFYMEFADKLLQYKEDRGPLIAGLHEIAEQHPHLPTKLDPQGRSATGHMSFHHYRHFQPRAHGCE